MSLFGLGKKVDPVEEAKKVRGLFFSGAVYRCGGGGLCVLM